MGLDMPRFFYIFIFLFVLSSNSQAVELCLAVDGSGSISSAEFTLQTEGIAQTIENPSIVPQDSSVRISVVQFSSSAQEEVSSTLVDNQTTASAVATSIRNMAQMGGGTNIGAGITTCTSTFVFASGEDQLIDVSTDGISSDPIPARDAAIAAGVDVVNALGIGSGVDVIQLDALVWPQPVSVIPNPGFVILAPDFAAFSAAMAAKIKAEVGPPPVYDATPVPTLSEWALIMLASLLAMIGFQASRRRS